MTLLHQAVDAIVGAGSFTLLVGSMAEAQD